MKTRIKGHTVEHDEDVRGGIRYLIHELDAEEAKVFFNQALNRGSCIFEDHFNKKYKLVHHGSEYQLTRA